MMIERQEFYRAVQDIRDDIQQVQARLDVVNGRTRQNEQDIAVLTHQMGERDSARHTWLGAVAGGVVAGLLALMQWLTGRH